ncbi:MAG: DNA polymerase III subunit delta [Pseudomonadota bacterium]
MQLKPAQLAPHLKQGLKPVYVVAGEEPLLIQETLDTIRAAARKDGYSEREVLEVTPGFQWNRLAEACASLSLFASRRIIELHIPRGLGGGRAKSDEESDGAEESGTGGGAQEGAKLLQQFAASPPPDTLLLVVAGALDKRAQGSAWFTALDGAGASLYFWPVRPEELPAWITARFKSAGLDADAEAVSELAERTEGNLLACAQDIEKMKLLFPNTRIGVAQVREVVADSAHFEAFDLIDKMLAGDGAGTARSLARIREEGVPLPQLMGAVTYSLRQWATAAVAYAKTRNLEAALADARLFGARARPYEAALRRSHGMPVLRALARCAKIDRLSKTTDGKEAAWEDLLELLLAAAGKPAFNAPPRS